MSEKILNKQSMAFSLSDFFKFKERYEQAVSNKEVQFIFEGGEFLTVYAKYVVEYLTVQFKPKEKLAYEKWLVATCMDEATIANQLIRDCKEGNERAFDLVGRVQSNDWTNETFLLAAKLILL